MLLDPLAYPAQEIAALYRLLLKWIALDPVPRRPNRLEPRAVKRRPKQYDLLNRPRHQLQKALLRR